MTQSFDLFTKKMCTIEKLFNTIIDWLKKAPLYKYILIFLFSSFLITLFTSFLFYFLINILHLPLIINSKQESFSGNSNVTKFIAVCLIAPLFETYIFQYGIIKWLSSTKMKNWFIVFISSLLFGLSHFYSLQYVVNTFFIGIVLALSFMWWINKKIDAFWVTAIIHALHNLCLLILSIYLNSYI